LIAAGRCASGGQQKKRRHPAADRLQVQEVYLAVSKGSADALCAKPLAGHDGEDIEGGGPLPVIGNQHQVGTLLIETGVQHAPL
jgi:hypothetical protein